MVFLAHDPRGSKTRALCSRGELSGSFFASGRKAGLFHAGFQGAEDISVADDAFSLIFDL